MNKLKNIKNIFIIMACACALTTSSFCFDRVAAESTTQAVAYTAPITVTTNPKAYLNKTITMKTKFDKFSTLGLDYKPAFRSSEDYISFLVKREDTTYDIPLSEMKIFIKRKEAEKFIDLKTDDIVSITGTVFSDALGDAWVDVKELKIVQKAPDKDGVK
mgnify:CR=1 FL=1